MHMCKWAALVTTQILSLLWGNIIKHAILFWYIFSDPRSSTLGKPSQKQVRIMRNKCPMPCICLVIITHAHKHIPKKNSSRADCTIWTPGEICSGVSNDLSKAHAMNKCSACHSWSSRANPICNPFDVDGRSPNQDRQNVFNEGTVGLVLILILLAPQ